MASLTLDGLTKSYGDNTVVQSVSLDVKDGEFLVLLGPSGCGKTTTLRMIAGFVPPSGGSIRIGERDITQLPPWKRNAGLVFQSYALFPHMTVAENVAFGLSGGEQQRVALARALVIRPDVLLLDEPLSNLDAKLRLEVRLEIRALQQQLGLTTVMVTHDQEEALTMADRLVVMSEGRVRQVGSQADLYERPADLFVADFVGRSTMIAGTVTGPGAFRSEGGLVLRCAVEAPQGPATVALRPERLTLGAEAAGLDNHAAGTVSFVSYLGAMLDVHVRLNDTDHVVAQIPNRADGRIPAVGDAITIGWPASACLVFTREAA